MTAYERWEAAWSYRQADRLALYTMGGRQPETYDRWLTEGLPADWQATGFFDEEGPAGPGRYAK